MASSNDSHESQTGNPPGLLIYIPLQEVAMGQRRTVALEDDLDGGLN
jgi:hypothetical protein